MLSGSWLMAQGGPRAAAGGGGWKGGVATPLSHEPLSHDQLSIKNRWMNDLFSITFLFLDFMVTFRHCNNVQRHWNTKATTREEERAWKLRLLSNLERLYFGMKGSGASKMTSVHTLRNARAYIRSDFSLVDGDPHCWNVDNIGLPDFRTYRNDPKCFTLIIGFTQQPSDFPSTYSKQKRIQQSTNDPPKFRATCKLHFPKLPGKSIVINTV